MNLKRITSSLLGFPLVAAALIFGNKYILDIAFCIVILLSLHEFFNAFKEKANPVRWVGYCCAIIIAFLHIIQDNISNEYIQFMLLLIIPIILLLLFLQIIITNMKTNFYDIAITFFGIIYIVGFSMFIPLIRGLDNGNILIWYILFISWGTDVFAYFVGKSFGKHKFTDISPKKTIEGSIGGVIGSLLFTMPYTYIVNVIFNQKISYIYILIITISLSILGQIGDLAASVIKRYVNIKDYSDLIPGHRWIAR